MRSDAISAGRGFETDCKNTVLFVTRSLHRECIRTGDLDTSSRVFEFGLLAALNANANVRVVHLGSEERQLHDVSGFRFCSVNYNSLLGMFRFARAIWQHRNAGDLSVLTTGYYPFEIITIVLCSRLFGGKSFSYIYDTHLTATKKMPRLRRTLVDVYFAVGFWWAQRLSGLLVLNDSFIKRRKLTLPFLKTKIGMNRQAYCRDLEAANERSARRKKIIVFAGTINSENGAELLMSFAEKNLDVDFELQFYGDGDCVNRLKELADSDSRVKYFGRILDSALQDRLRNADLLVNLRDPSSVACAYSFPSKLINFMATGIPVMSNRFPGLDDSYVPYLYLAEGFEEGAVAEKLLSLLNDEIDRLVGESALEFVAEQHQWSAISRDVLEFIK